MKTIKEVLIPGSKSFTNRALLLSCLTEKETVINNPLFSDDTKTMIHCLKALGASFKIEKNKITVIRKINTNSGRTYILNSKISGTTMRFLLSLCAVIPGIKILTGDSALCKRPIKDLVDTLISLGAKIEYLQKIGFPPVKILNQIERSTNLKETTLRADTSSQYLSSLLMVAPLIGNLKITTEGNEVSKPYTKMTIEIMKKFGIEVKNNQEKTYIIDPGQRYKCSAYNVEGDISSACYFAAIAVLTNSTIKIKNINPNSTQADMEFFEILKQMGNKIKSGKNSITVIGENIKPINVNMTNCPDQIQTLAVLASFAKGKTQISGVSTLKIKETNRLKAIENELLKMGIKTEVNENSLTIYGGNPKPAIIETYGDHRMAMAFAIAGFKLNSIKINNPDVVSKTFPNFWKEIRKIGITKNIVLIGFMGAGKSSIAPLLAKNFNYTVVEMDNLAIQESGRNSVSEIFEKDGEIKFRKLEEKIAQILKNKKNIVISTGGGIVSNEETLTTLKDNSIVIFLQATFETVQKRIVDKSNRPLWKDVESTRKLYQHRLPIYQKHADIIITTDEKSKKLITKEILEKINTIYTKPKTKVCMIIGDPIEHSLSPKMHNAAYKALKIDNEYIFLAKKVKPEELEKTITILREENIHGITVTIPHKINVLQYIDKVDKIAKKIGAVNTILNKNGVLTGYNTDWIGIAEPLKKLTNLNKKHVAILGAGGAARAAIYAMIQNNANITIFNRTLKLAAQLSKEFNCTHESIGNLELIKKADIIINTTSVGLVSYTSPIDTSIIEKRHVVFDIVYKPYETKLLKDAKEKGAKIISGVEMLLYQGVAQFEIFTNKKAPIEIMRKEILNNIDSNK